MRKQKTSFTETKLIKKKRETYEKKLKNKTKTKNQNKNKSVF